MNTAVGSDTLTAYSRDFYERAKLKLFFSFVAAAASVTLLGFCSIASGLSNNYEIEANNSTGDFVDANDALASGYGFASFTYVLSFILLMSMSIYLCPFCTG